MLELLAYWKLTAPLCLRRERWWFSSHPLNMLNFDLLILIYSFNHIECLITRPLIKILCLTFHSTSPLKMSLLAMSTLFQATASFSSSRKSWASWLWLLQADTHTQTECQQVYILWSAQNVKTLSLSNCQVTQPVLLLYSLRKLPVSR